VALSPEIRGAAERDIGRFCAARSSGDYRFEYEVRGDAITLRERRPPWRPEPGAEWSALDIAQLRYGGRSWTLYWKRSNGRWQRYDGIGPAVDVGALLAEIDADPDGVFWG
jgi:hypothetical protein